MLDILGIVRFMKLYWLDGNFLNNFFELQVMKNTVF